MTLFQALAKAEELKAGIMHPGSGMRFKNNNLPYDNLRELPALGWTIDDQPVAIAFRARLLGVDLMDASDLGGKRGSIYSFEGSESFAYMPDGTLVEVKITPV